MAPIPRVVVAFALGALLGTAAWAEKPPRSACNKHTQGSFWPEAANADRKLAGQLMRSGELQMCTRGFFRYNWEPLTINVGAILAKKPQSEPQAANHRTPGMQAVAVSQ